MAKAPDPSLKPGGKIGEPATPKGGKGKDSGGSAWGKSGGDKGGK